MRRRIAAGNWKMNMDLSKAMDLTEQIVTLSSKTGVELILAPPTPVLFALNPIISGLSYISLAGQNMHQATHGAYTGDVSASMLRSVGASYVILGHSERREYYCETDDLILEKIRVAVDHKLKPIYCCGEKLDERKSGQHEATVLDQLQKSVLKLSPTEVNDLIIAYEPVWAIGTGETASPQQAQDMHGFIRTQLLVNLGSDVADRTPILYGGSVKPGNAEELFSQPDVDGGLVGGASLKAQDFVAISQGFK